MVYCSHAMPYRDCSMKPLEILLNPLMALRQGYNSGLMMYLTSENPVNRYHHLTGLLSEHRRLSLRKAVENVALMDSLEKQILDCVARTPLPPEMPPIRRNLSSDMDLLLILEKACADNEPRGQFRAEVVARLLPDAIKLTTLSSLHNYMRHSGYVEGAAIAANLIVVYAKATNADAGTAASRRPSSRPK